jgi:hypothetical protein
MTRAQHSQIVVALPKNFPSIGVSQVHPIAATGKHRYCIIIRQSTCAIKEQKVTNEVPEDVFLIDFKYHSFTHTLKPFNMSSEREGIVLNVCEPAVRVKTFKTYPL